MAVRTGMLAAYVTYAERDSHSTEGVAAYFPPIRHAAFM